jgi:hypothetical protein
MFVVYVCPCTVEARSDGIVETTIYHEKPPKDHKWCLVTFKNTPDYPATRVDHFDSLPDAQEYFRKVAPGVPLVSLGGHSPYPPIDFETFQSWQSANGLEDYDFRKVFQPGGENAREVIFTRKR